MEHITSPIDIKINDTYQEKVIDSVIFHLVFALFEIVRNEKLHHRFDVSNFNKSNSVGNLNDDYNENQRVNMSLWFGIATIVIHNIIMLV